MKNHTTGVILFPAISVAIVTLLVNGFGVIAAGGAERTPTTSNRIIGLLIGIVIMLCLYGIPRFRKWVPNKKNLGSSIFPVFAAIIVTAAAAAFMYEFVVNETLGWITSPSWLDGRKVVRGMLFVVLTARWIMK